MSPDPQLLRELVALVREAGGIAQEARGDLRRELKPDVSIVTEGDKSVEQFLRPALRRLVPNTGVYGEEFGHDGEGPAGLWAVDPVDGTSNYAFGSPLWGVSVALLQGEDIVLGVVYLPDLGELYSAGKGMGACCNGEQLPEIPRGPVKPEELLSYNGRAVEACGGAPFPGKMRCSGAFVIDAMWVARQRFRGLVGMHGKLYDIAASMLINQEIGAKVSYADGDPIDLNALKTGITVPKPYVFLPQGAELKR